MLRAVINPRARSLTSSGDWSVHIVLSHYPIDQQSVLDCCEQCVAFAILLLLLALMDVDVLKQLALARERGIEKGYGQRLIHTLEGRAAECMCVAGWGVAVCPCHGLSVTAAMGDLAM